MTEYYAHSIDNPDQSLWQLLSEHLCGVAKLARQFAEMALLGDAEFAETAYTAGLLHDLGKYREEFQQLLRGSQKKSEQTRHKQAGTAKAAVARRLDVAFAIGGHHGGLPDSSALKELVAAPGGRDVAEPRLGSRNRRLPRAESSTPKMARQFGPAAIRHLGPTALQLPCRCGLAGYRRVSLQSKERGIRAAVPRVDREEHR